MLLALTGKRREDVAQMGWDEVCPTSRTWTIPGARAKNGRPHVVHLHVDELTLDAAGLLITARPTAAQAVCPTLRARLDAGAPWRAWPLPTSGTGLPDLTGARPRG